MLLVAPALVLMVLASAIPASAVPASVALVEAVFLARAELVEQVSLARAELVEQVSLASRLQLRGASSRQAALRLVASLAALSEQAAWGVTLAGRRRASGAQPEMRAPATRQGCG